MFDVGFVLWIIVVVYIVCCVCMYIVSCWFCCVMLLCGVCVMCMCWFLLLKSVLVDKLLLDIFLCCVFGCFECVCVLWYWGCLMWMCECLWGFCGVNELIEWVLCEVKSEVGLEGYNWVGVLCARFMIYIFIRRYLWMRWWIWCWNSLLGMMFCCDWVWWDEIDVWCFERWWLCVWWIWARVCFRRLSRRTLFFRRRSWYVCWCFC